VIQFEAARNAIRSRPSAFAIAAQPYCRGLTHHQPDFRARRAESRQVEALQVEACQLESGPLSLSGCAKIERRDWEPAK
jgi:hypothetical protein